MRLRYITIILCFFFLIGCSTDDNDVSYQSITVSLKNTESYTYNMGQFGPEDFAVLNKDASNARESKLEFVQGKMSYIYLPEMDYTGMDFVEIRQEKNSSSNQPLITLTTINFDITE